MQEGEQDFHAAQDYLAAIIHDTRSRFLHLNQLSFGALPVPRRDSSSRTATSLRGG